MSFTSLLYKMLVLFFFLLVGVLCSKLGYLDAPTGRKLNKVLLNICAPLLVFHSVLTTEYGYAVGDILLLLLYAAAFNLIMMSGAFLLSRTVFRREADRGTWQFLLSFGNCVFMGFPVIASLYGNGAVFLGSVCSIPFNIFVYSLGVLMVRKRGEGRGELWRLLLNPPFLSNLIALGLFLLRVRAPEPVTEAFGYLGNMVVPLSMMLIGISLSAMHLREIFSGWRVYALCLGKLAALPLLVFFICRLFISDPLFLNIITVSAVMPSASVAPIVSAEYGGNAALASRGVFITTICSLATIPVMLSLLLV